MSMCVGEQTNEEKRNAYKKEERKRKREEQKEERYKRMNLHHCIKCDEKIDLSNDMTSANVKQIDRLVNAGYSLRYIKNHCAECRETLSIKKYEQINLLEGLSEHQESLVKSLVRRGYHPLGLSVDVNTDTVYYFGNVLNI